MNDISDVDKLCSDEVFKQLLAEAYKGNTVTQKDFFHVLIEYKTKVSELHGEDVAKLFENNMLCMWDLQDKNNLPKPKRKIEYRKANELIKEEFPPTEYIVDGLISKGLIVISAKSKIGKSWFVFQLGIAVANGDSFLGLNTNKGGVLYLDLEENEAFCQSRLIKLIGEKEAPAMLTICNEYSTMNDTFMDDIVEYLEAYKDTSLIIIDVYQKIKKPKKNNQSDYEDIYTSFAPLKELASKYSLAIILVMHDRKMTDENDPFANILGSTAIMGSSDEAIVIHKKKRTDNEATLSITGRTVATDDFQIYFDKESCKWEMLGSSQEILEKRAEAEYRNNPIVKTILKLIEQGDGEYSGKVHDIIFASSCFNGCKIHSNSTKVGKELRTLFSKMEKYDSVYHTETKYGNDSAKHHFKKVCLK